jgi:predicted RNase H-like HicB family nuclease
MALRYYPACIERAGDAYSVVFPDLPGCVSAGDTVQDAAVNAAEALAMHIEGMAEDRQDPPAPTPVDAPLPHWLVADGEPAFVARILVPVEMPGRAVRANITMDEGLLRRVDAAAAAGGFTRSGFLAQAARERLERPDGPAAAAGGAARG